MNWKRLAIACVAVYVAYQALGYVIHELLLSGTYKSLETVWRTEADMAAKMPFMVLSSAVWTVLFCYIYTKGRERGGAVEGLRYGLLIGLFIGIPWAYESWILYPITLNLSHAWFASTLVITGISGLLCGAIYKPAAAEA